MIGVVLAEQLDGETRERLTAVLDGEPDGGALEAATERRRAAADPERLEAAGPGWWLLRRLVELC